MISVSNHPPRCTGYRWSPVSWRQELLHARSLLTSPFSLLPPPSLRDAWRNRRAGALERAIHALLSPLFSLLPAFEAHCKVSTHCSLPSSPSSLLSAFRGYISYRLAEQGVRESLLRLDTHFHKIRRFSYQCRYRMCLKGYSSKKLRLAVILDDQQPTNQEIPTLKFLLPLI